MNINTTHFKEALEKEKAKLISELKGVGRINPDNPKDWEATPGDLNIPSSDKNDMGDAMEEYEGRNAIEIELENRLAEVDKALVLIDKGTYGVCRVGGEEIEIERLEANPAATTCKAHINE